MMGTVRRIICSLAGHDWTHRPEAIPEDRESFRCERCGEWTLAPPSVGMPDPPEEYDE